MCRRLCCKTAVNYTAVNHSLDEEEIAFKNSLEAQNEGGDDIDELFNFSGQDELEFDTNDLDNLEMLQVSILREEPSSLVLFRRRLRRDKAVFVYLRRAIDNGNRLAPVEERVPIAARVVSNGACWGAENVRSRSMEGSPWAPAAQRPRPSLCVSSTLPPKAVCASFSRRRRPALYLCPKAEKLTRLLHALSLSFVVINPRTYTAPPAHTPRFWVACAKLTLLVRARRWSVFSRPPPYVPLETSPSHDRPPASNTLCHFTPCSRSALTRAILNRRLPRCAALATQMYRSNLGVPANPRGVETGLGKDGAAATNGSGREGAGRSRNGAGGGEAGVLADTVQEAEDLEALLMGGGVGSNGINRSGGPSPA